jgi:N utilization substance protein B
LYQWLVGGHDSAAVEGNLTEDEGFREFESSTDVAHFRELLHGAIDGAEALRADFARFIDRDVKELSPVEHAILLIGTYELRHRMEIPYRVVINEAVELCKRFGATDAHKYVNAVLDRAARELRSAER